MFATNHFILCSWSTTCVASQAKKLILGNTYETQITTLLKAW